MIVHAVQAREPLWLDVRAQSGRAHCMGTSMPVSGSDPGHDATLQYNPLVGWWLPHAWVLVATWPSTVRVMRALQRVARRPLVPCLWTFAGAPFFVAMCGDALAGIPGLGL